MFLDNKYTQIYNKLIENAKSRKMTSGYVERHHVRPRSLGGTNTEDNIVVLTAREHFVCHRLLTKMVNGRALHKMQIAICMMMVKNPFQERKIVINSRTFEKIRTEMATASSILQKGKTKNLSKETRKRLGELVRERKPAKGQKLSDKHKELLLTFHIGIPLSEETKSKISKGNTGKKRSDETKRKISIGNKGKTTIHTAASRERISAALKGRPSPMRGKIPWNKGGKHDVDSIKKMSTSHQNREMISCIHCGLIFQKPNYNRWHGDKCKMKS